MIKAPPQRFGAINNAHQIVVQDSSNESAAPYRECFENLFNDADRCFPEVIRWIECLKCNPADDNSLLEDRFNVVSVSDDKLQQLVTGLFSLVVRSPANRDECVAPAELLSSYLPKRERELLIAANLKNRMRNCMDQIDTLGKFVFCFSHNNEFIFGDGFYHTISFWETSFSQYTILVPLTPDITVLHVRPMSYMVEPRVMTLSLNEVEVQFLNLTIQIYSKQEIFFRSQCPDLTEYFQRAKRFRYANGNHVLSDLVSTIPGIHPRVFF